MPETKGQIIVPAGLEQRKRALQMVARFRVFSGETVSSPEDPMRDTGLGRIRHRLDAGEEGRRVRSHRRKIAPHVAADPQAVVCRQPPRRILVPGSRFAGSSEGLHCFPRPMTSCRYERVAIGGVQLRQPLTYGSHAAWLTPRRLARLIRHLDRLAEMGNRLLERRTAQRLIARLPPPPDSEIVEPSLREVMRDDFRFSHRSLWIVAQEFGGEVERLAAALEQTVRGGVLDQRVLEAIVGLRGSALDKQKVGVSKPIQR